MNSSLDIPGYARAVMEESLTRTAAFLVDGERIGPFEVEPLRFRTWLILSMVHSPILTKRIPTPEQLAQFLWLVSPGYRPGAQLGRWLFLRRCRSVFMPPSPPLIKSNRSVKRWQAETDHKLKVAADTIDAARKYVEEALMDLPAPEEPSKYTRSYYSDAASVIGIFAREFHGMFSEREVLEMPMKKILQYLNEAKKNADPKCPLHNPSDDIANAWVAQRNRIRKLQKQN